MIVENILVRIDCDDWFTTCPVAAIKRIKYTSTGWYEVEIDATAFPHPNEKFYVRWNQVALLVIGGVPVPDEVMSEAGAIAALHEFLQID